MVKRWLSALVLCLFLGGIVNLPQAAALPAVKDKIPPGQLKKFIDSGEAPWAADVIEKMGEMGIMAGYPDGRFLPNKPVTQLEALIMATRLLGWTPEQGQGNSIMSKIKAKGVPAWGAWVVALAVEKDILPEDLKKFQPNKPATRAEIAEIIINALEAFGKEEAQIRAILQRWKDGEPVWFTDELDIPGEYMNHVRYMARLGLMKGYPDGSFQPNKPVTRAQMAAILDRIGELVDEWKDSAAVTVGYIVYHNTDANQVYLWTTGEKLVKVELSAYLKVYRDGQLLSINRWNRLSIGDKVYLYKMDDDVVKFYAYSSNDQIKIKGVVWEIDDEEITLQVGFGSSYIYPTYPLDEDLESGAVAAGSEVEVFLKTGAVVQISIIVP